MGGRGLICAAALAATALVATCGAPQGPVPKPPTDYVESIPGTDVRFEMIWVDDGGFWIGRTEVTWDEYLLYCDFDGNRQEVVDGVTRPSRPLDWTPYDRDWGAGRRPAVGMSWGAAKAYCAWLSGETGRGYRLPTEEEWALACAPSPGPLDARAWHRGNSDSKTQEVGLKAANAHGVCDMLGNLWEYCDSPWSAEEPDRAVLRGGSWKNPAAALSRAARLGFDDDWTLRDPNYPPGVWWVPDGDHLGFRLLRPGTAESGIMDTR